MSFFEESDSPDVRVAKLLSARSEAVAVLDSSAWAAVQRLYVDYRALMLSLFEHGAEDPVLVRGRLEGAKAVYMMAEHHLKTIDRLIVDNGGSVPE